MKLKRGQMLSIEFSDHVENGNHSIRFVVYGRLVSITRSALSVDSWAYAGRKHKHDHNQTRFTIVRSAIHRIARLVESEVIEL